MSEKGKAWIHTLTFIVAMLIPTSLSTTDAYYVIFLYYKIKMGQRFELRTRFETRLNSKTILYQNVDLL